MLAKKARITTADDYRAAVRRGARFSAAHTLTYVRRGDGPARFGFIVSKQVGVAVTRNTVRRRLKAASYALAPSVVADVDIVVRALPGAASASFGELKAELVRSLVKARVLESASSHEGSIVEGRAQAVAK